MRRKDWLLLTLTIFIIIGAGIGLYSYKAHQSTQTENQALESLSQAGEQALPEGTPSVKLWVTRDFGNTVLVEKQVPFHEGDTVMDLLKKNVTNVVTTYNGGFVNSINGLESGYRAGDATSKKLDWFFSVNGLTATVGGQEFPVHQGDIIWWDYHSWEYAMNVPAQIGVFPHPFVTGVTGESVPVKVMYSGNVEQVAEPLTVQLGELKKQAIKPVQWDEKQFDENQALIIVGDRQSLLKSAFVQKMMQEQAALGLFAKLTEQGIQTYDQNGKEKKLYTDKNDVLIMSTKNPSTDQPILLVAGNSGEGIQSAIEQLQQPADTNSFSRMFGAMWTNNQAVRLPADAGTGAAQ